MTETSKHNYKALIEQKKMVNNIIITPITENNNFDTKTCNVFSIFMKYAFETDPRLINKSMKNVSNNKRSSEDKTSYITITATIVGHRR